jgi:integrase/recombinase XerC
MTSRKPRARATRPAHEAIADQVEQFLDERKAIRRPKPLRPATLAQLGFNLRPFAEWCRTERITTAANVTDAVMDKFANYLEGRASLKDKTKKLSASSQRTYLRNVRTFLNWAGTPRGDFQMPAESSQPKWADRLLSRDEIDRMIKTAVSTRDKLIVRVLADTGIRLGELLSLTGNDLLTDRRSGGYAIRVRGKVGQRTIGVPQSLYKRLRTFADDRETNTEPLFIGSRRRAKSHAYEPLTKSGVQQMIAHVAIEAGVATTDRPVHPHLFRHSLASHLLKENAPPLVVKGILGHKSLAMLDVYGHTDEADHAAILTNILGR